MRVIKRLTHPALLLLLVLVVVGAVQAATGPVDSTDRWAWGTNVGWVNLNPQCTGCTGVTVYDDHLEGYAWGENVGWIRLGTHTGGDEHTYANSTADNYGVNYNPTTGALSGYAWGTNIGWINFDPDGDEGVTIATDRSFSGHAWGENVGWLRFQGTALDGTAYQVVVADAAPEIRSVAQQVQHNTLTTIAAEVRPNSHAAASTHVRLLYRTTPGTPNDSKTALEMTPATMNGDTWQDVTAALTTQAGQTYYYVISATNRAGTTASTERQFTALDGVPLVTTEGAKDIGKYQATVTGTVNVRGETGTVRFQYGETAAYGQLWPADAAELTNNTAEAWETTITGLPADTVYHYALSATNSVATSVGGDKTFLTLPEPPGVPEPQPATNIGRGTAVVNAVVNPNAAHWPAEVFVSYWATGVSTKTQVVQGGLYGTTSQSASGLLTGLQADTTYYIVMTATNASGVSARSRLASFHTGFAASTGDIVGVGVDRGAVQSVQSLSIEELPPGCADDLLAERDAADHVYPYDFRYGFFRFELTDITAGDTVRVSWEFPELLPGAHVFKCVQTAPDQWEWLDITAAPDVQITDNRLSYTVRDVSAWVAGQRDSNITAGEITDPVGVAYSTLSIPTLTEWGLLAFVGLLGGYAVRRLRKTRRRVG